jgi:hypothetical protein
VGFQARRGRAAPARAFSPDGKTLAAYDFSNSKVYLFRISYSK